MLKEMAFGLALAMPTVAMGQAIKPEPPVRQFSTDEIGSIELPDTQFEETPQISADYDKYFYFHRADTSFGEAFADISECDALASGISYYGGGDGTVPYPYAGTMSGAVGGIVGSLVADAIFGSAERRRIRRVNMRNCMGFKEYSRYGMERERWQAFHFEEGFSAVKGDKRETYLMKQAAVASGPKPLQEVLAP